MGSGIQATEMKRKQEVQGGERAQTIGGFFRWPNLCGKEIQHVKVVMGSEAKLRTVSPTQLWPTCDGEDPSRGCYTQCGNVHCLEGSLRTPTIDYSWEV